MDPKSKCSKKIENIIIESDTETTAILLFSSKLTELKSSLSSSISLSKLFKQNFIDSLVYLIKSEHKTQLDFSKHIQSNEFEWSQLNFALNEIKRICKQKNDLILFLNKMNISCNNENNNAKTTISNINNSDDSNSCCSSDRIELTNELDSHDEFFSLIKILIRFLFKLIKLKQQTDNDDIQNLDQTKIFNLKLLLLSCLADLCHYDEIKLQVTFYFIYLFLCVIIF
jgi:hypothetical protein